MPSELLPELAAAVALIGLMAYTVLGGADFGGGVWDLFATGPRKAAQRDAIAKAMGPVWEANHVWLIFVIVVLFTCFPRGFAALVTAMFLPFHLALIGIMLRGAAFVFRGFTVVKRDRDAVAPQEVGINSGSTGKAEPIASTGYESVGKRSVWGVVFGIASVVAPFVLGAVFGALTAGDVRVSDQGVVTLAHPLPWLRPYAVGCGLLALSTCAYLAAVYLTAETQGFLRQDFRRRAILAGTATAALAAIVLVLAYYEARWFCDALIGWRSAPVIAAGLFFFAVSAWAVFRGRYRLSRVFAAGEIVLMLLGWGLAHRPFLVYPDLTLAGTAGPPATVRFLLLALPFGALLLVPSLGFLFAVFKAQRR